MTRVRRGFTIVELLVVITIIGMLMALLLVAIQAARAAVIRANCGNNLGQIAKATLSYTHNRGAFPGYKQTLAAHEAPWTVVLLPQLQRSDVYDFWPNPAVANADLPRVVLKIYQCPGDKPADVNSPKLAYVGNVGASSLVAESAANGVLLDRTAGGSGQTVRPEAIADGAATTLLLSENRQATLWPNTGRMEVGFMWHPTTSPLPEYRINRGIDLPLSESTARPSSVHGGVVNAAFCDGHVKYLSDDLDYKVYLQLMTPDGRQSDMPAAWKSYVLNESDY